MELEGLDMSRPGLDLSLGAKTVAFVVTQQCNFRCRYCYMVHKGDRRMSFETAKTAIDYFLRERELFPQREVVWEFIGGEPLLEIDLMTQICHYVQEQAFLLRHPWFEECMFSISTNGVLYNDPRFQKLLDAYPSRWSVGLTIDGPAHVHDRERVFPDGSGTHAAVEASVRSWLQRFPNAPTKVTLSHDTLPTIKETILYLFGLGIKTVHANVVFEDVWQPGDDEIFEAQLDALGDALVQMGMNHQYECSLFRRTIGDPVSREEDGNWCGAGKHMITVDYDGKFYPCTRFVGFTLAKQPGWVIGDIHRGIDRQALEPLMHMSRSSMSTEECMGCECASGCAWCVGFNYDESGDLKHRATYICKMHKARARANKRFWARIDSLGGSEYGREKWAGMRVVGAGLRPGNAGGERRDQKALP